MADMADDGTIVHEYVHGLQPALDPGAVKWINEMVAEAIGTAWVMKNGGASGVYEPNYSMVLDREFYDGKDDPGYGKWDYALEVGRRLGSRDAVAYLAQDGILDASRKGYATAMDAMKIWHDTALVRSATFDKVFPDYVARFNNVEEGGGGLDRTGRYFYYGAIARHDVEVTGAGAPFETELDGEAKAFAAHPMLLSLKVETADGSDPADNVMVADVEVVGGGDDLTLVREPRRAREKTRDYFMLDGNAPPEELGFFRVAHTPPPDEDAAATFGLKVTTRPVSFDPPACLQAGQPGEMVVRGLDGMPADNWRLEVDNGTVDDLTITPARAGEVTVTLEIDSPITRRETGLDPKAPENTRVELGSYDVAADDCMMRLEIGPVAITYVSDGSFTEFRTDSGESMYFAATDLALWDGGWQHVPAQAKAMIVSGMKRNNAMLRLDYPGAHDDEGDFMSQMPKIWSERFSWANLKNVRAMDGGTPKRRPVACPDGGSGCSGTTFSMDGNAVPVVFDAQRRPRLVTFDGHDVVFRYGTFDVRRPPGW